MYEFAYNEVIDDSRQAMRAREHQAMDRVIAMLRAAQAKGPAVARAGRGALLSAPPLAIFLDDLKDPNNELPEQLRAGIISIGIWMMKEIERVRAANDRRPHADDRDQRNHPRRTEVRRR